MTTRRGSRTLLLMAMALWTMATPGFPASTQYTNGMLFYGIVKDNTQQANPVAGYTIKLINVMTGRYVTCVSGLATYDPGTANNSPAGSYFAYQFDLTTNGAATVGDLVAISAQDQQGNWVPCTPNTFVLGAGDIVAGIKRIDLKVH